MNSHCSPLLAGMSHWKDNEEHFRCLDNRGGMPASFFSTPQFNLWKAQGKNGRHSEPGYRHPIWTSSPRLQRKGLLLQIYILPLSEHLWLLDYIAKPGLFSPPINQIASIEQIFIDDTLWAKHWHRVCEEQKRSVWNDSNCICEIIQGPYETGKKWEYAVQNESERKWYQKGDNLLQIILLGLSIGLILFQVLWGT